MAGGGWWGVVWLLFLTVAPALALTASCTNFKPRPILHRQSFTSSAPGVSRLHCRHVAVGRHMWYALPQLVLVARVPASILSCCDRVADGVRESLGCEVLRQDGAQGLGWGGGLLHGCECVTQCGWRGVPHNFVRNLAGQCRSEMACRGHLLLAFFVRGGFPTDLRRVDRNRHDGLLARWEGDPDRQLERTQRRWRCMRRSVGGVGARRVAQSRRWREVIECSGSRVVNWVVS